MKPFFFRSSLSLSLLPYSLTSLSFSRHSSEHVTLTSSQSCGGLHALPQGSASAQRVGGRVEERWHKGQMRVFVLRMFVIVGLDLWGLKKVGWWRNKSFRWRGYVQREVKVGR
jgi:hypothetical protein